ncbi:MAG: hypothetical protein MAG715_00713 [Methanonatronarchaeales archaeon]|nr:hypothetical protein [Methanonatronarchaeales archaeon]
MDIDNSTRLYGGSIAVISGGYSAYLSAGVGGVASTSMLLLGIVVLVHGLAVLSGYGGPGGLSGPLMMLWGVLMLSIQAAALAMPMSVAMTLAPGMVTMGVLMLVSGYIMTASTGT